MVECADNHIIMPTREHDALVLLFQNRPSLAAELYAWVSGQQLPDFVEARIEDPAVPELKISTRRGDCLVTLRDARQRVVLGIIVEIQRSQDPDKRWIWPLYSAAHASELGCPVVVLVVCTDRAVAAWAERTVEQIRRDPTVRVLGPDAVPRLADLPEARRSAELAVLAVQAHGREPDALSLVQEALEAADGLPTSLVMVYFDLIMASVSEALRRELEELMQPGQYEYQSEFARRYFGEGRDKGIEEGIEKGIEKGRLDAQQTLARRLLARGMAVAEVALLTDLPEDQVRTLH
jgi:hypothetical protein